MDGQRVQAVGDERFSVAFHFDLFGRDLFCVTDVSVSQRRAHWHRASDPRVAWGFCPGGGWAPSSAAPDGLDKPMLRGANRRAIVPIVLAVHPSGDCLNRPGCSPVGRLSQSSWLFTPSGDCPNRPGCSPVGRLSQSSWLFGCSLKPAPRLLLADQAQASGSRLALSESSVGAYLKKHL